MRLLKLVLTTYIIIAFTAIDQTVSENTSQTHRRVLTLLHTIDNFCLQRDVWVIIIVLFIVNHCFGSNLQFVVMAQTSDS